MRAALAREHALAVGLGVPIVRQNEVEHVLVFLTAQRSPPARAIEIWIPDAQGRLWMDHGAYDTGLEALGRASRTTCLMPGEGVAGRAAKAGEPLLWSRQSKQNDATDSDAARAGLVLGIALPWWRAPAPAPSWCCGPSAWALSGGLQADVRVDPRQEARAVGPVHTPSS
ncbi:MAG: hypothetical protein IPN77_13375 [Sandaracinaceae bacterium]|nr:hypothetical protein [Sandaracinaceae bacterium]